MKKSFLLMTIAFVFFMSAVFMLMAGTSNAATSKPGEGIVMVAGDLASIQNIIILGQADGSVVSLATRRAPLTPAWAFTLIDDTKLGQASKVDGLAGQLYVMTILRPTSEGFTFSQMKEQDGDLRMASTEMITGDSAYGGRFAGDAPQAGIFYAMKMKSAQ